MVVMVLPCTFLFSFTWLPCCETKENPNSRIKIFITSFPENVLATANFYRGYHGHLLSKNAFLLWHIFKIELNCFPKILFCFFYGFTLAGYAQLQRTGNKPFAFSSNN